MRESVVMHSQHSLGIGHLQRSFAIAEALARSFDVVLLNGGPIPRGLSVPRAVRRIDLPPIVMASDHALRSADPANSLPVAMAERRNRIAAVVSECRPAAVMVDLFPFGRKKFREELVAFLQSGRAAGARTVASVREILVRSRRDQVAFDRRALEAANRWIDLVLVHGRWDWTPFVDSFPHAARLRPDVSYTGYVSRPHVAAAPPTRTLRREVVVSLGGGRHGAALRSIALEAQPILWNRCRLATLLVAGPLVADADWRRLVATSDRRPGLRLLRSVPDLRVVLERAAVSVSQCGYNTFADLLQTGVPAVVVPFEAPGEDEQRLRAERMHARNLVTHLPLAEASGQRLADAVIRAEQRGRRSGMKLDGADVAARRVARLVRGRTPGCREVGRWTG